MAQLEQTPLSQGQHSEVQLGPQGRLVIPAPLRKALGLSSGDALVARLEGSRLVLEKREAVLERLRAAFATIPPEISLSDELIAERREAARRETETEEE